MILDKDERLSKYWEHIGQLIDPGRATLKDGHAPAETAEIVRKLCRGERGAPCVTAGEPTRYVGPVGALGVPGAR